mgnify:FL=1|tara:strand:- start:90 stop:422 length:333 start_codon:yes stop_codon:yes gene_type:complete
MIFAILYILICVAMLGAAFALIFKNLSDIDKLEKGVYNINEKTTFVTKSIHPEMDDVQVGDELLVVRFDEPKKEQDPRFKLDSPELHNLGDSMYDSLKERIDELEDDGTD